MNVKSNDGISLVALIITIVILLIISTVSITAGRYQYSKYTDSVLEDELKIVQTTIYNQYEKYMLLKDSSLLVGTACDENGNEDENGEYKLLTPADLKTIGIDKAKDTYIVNYKTGEVINHTNQKTSDGKLLKIEGNE